jgi:hypothetical protein
MFTSRPRARRAPATIPMVAALALALLLFPRAVRADQPPTVEVTVGDSRPLGGAGARCDDLAVVSVTLGVQAVVTGLKPGRTLCSVAVGGPGGARRVFQVVVLAAAPRPPERKPAAPGTGGSPKPKASDGERRPDGG